MRILVLAESFTVSHVIRPAVLLQSLLNEHEIHFATSLHENLIDPRFICHRLNSLSPKEIKSRFMWGKDPFPASDIDNYISEDMNIIGHVKPDYIIGDLRLSLGISARLSKVPCAHITNAYWSPYSEKKFHPHQTYLSSFFPTKFYNFLFKIITPSVIKSRLDQVNKIREKYGFHRLQSLFEYFVDADHVFHPDIPAIVPMENKPQSHIYIGHLSFSRSNEFFHESIQEFAKRKPLIFISFGSSGNSRLLEVIIQKAGQSKYSFVIALAGYHLSIGLMPKNVLVCNYVDINKLMPCVDLAICHGGSSLSYPFLNKGIPVLCIPSNDDQFMASHFVSKTGAGVLLRAENISLILEYIDMILNCPEYIQKAQYLSLEFSKYDASAIFRNWIQVSLPK